MDAVGALHSFPFMFMLGLIAVAIAICTINRAPSIWHSIANPTITTTRGFIRNAEVSASYTLAGERDDVANRVIDTLRRRRYRVASQIHNDEVHIYADRFRWGKLGTFPFHLALILILVGGIIGARYGFRDTMFVVPEGSTRAIGHGTGLSVQVTKFTDTYRENGQAKEYRSDLVLLKDGKPVKSGSITVNHPMTYRNVVVYQASFGQAATMRITDAAGNVLYDDSVELGAPWFAAGNPEAPAGIIDLPQIGMQLNVIAPDNNPSSMPALDKLHLGSGEMYLQLRTRAGEVTPAESRIAQGQTVSLADLRVTFVRERQFSLMQVSNNPGIPIFWLSAFLMVGGLAVVFYFPHRRLRGIVSRTAGGSVTAALAPLAKRDWSAKREFGKTIEALATTLGVTPVVDQRADDDEALAPVYQHTAGETA